jgi:adenylate cyclase, class 2
MRSACIRVQESIVSVETEIKIRIEDPVGFCRQLDFLNPGILSARHFEDNYLFDFSDQGLRSRHCLLRVRITTGGCFLTYKGPPQQEGIFKTREELETRIEDAATLLQIFEGIGMRISFRYQKYRREYALNGVHIAVDETPIGNYAEIEGSEDGIRDLARSLGIAESQFLRHSYYALYVEHCKEKGVAPQCMVF